MPPATKTKTPLEQDGVFRFITLLIIDEFVVYILYSEKFNKNYTGFTSNLIERFKFHYGNYPNPL